MSLATAGKLPGAGPVRPDYARPAHRPTCPPGALMSLKITVIGTGYLGATHAAAMAELGFEVLGLDVVPEKIEMLQRGEVPMYEPGLEDLLRKHVAGIEGSTGRLRFTMDFAEVGGLRRRPLRLREHPAAARRVRRRHVVRRRRDRLPRPAPHRPRPRRRQVDRAGRLRRPARRLPRRARAGRRGRRAGLEPGVPARGLRGAGHAAPGPDRGRRAQRAGGEAAARGVRDAGRPRARRSSSPTSRPPSW